ncbi:hypothetical protein ACHAPT_012299 [Fusarium lateritium]
MRSALNLMALFVLMNSLVHEASAISQPTLLAQFPPSVRIENLTILPNGTVVHRPSQRPRRRRSSLVRFLRTVLLGHLWTCLPIPATANNFSWDEGLVEPGSNVVQHVTLTKTGVKTKAFPIPSAGWLNGLTPVPGSPHYLLIADCAAGSLLRLDTRTGCIETVLSDPLFAPVPAPGLDLTLGINGVHALGRWLYFTNTDQRLYGRLAITHEGLAVGTPAEVIAHGLKGSTFDDFALRRDGVAFLATGLGELNGIEKVTAVGKGRMVASWEYGSPVISQPVSAVFGQTKRDRATLYFATAGAYLGPNTTSSGGQLFSLDVGCHHVTILARNTSNIGLHERLTVVKGSVLSEEDMSRAFSASGTPVDSVLQCLNPVRANDWNPWAKFHGPARLLADATSIAARELREQQPQPKGHKPRLIAMNALGAGESRKVSPLITKFIIDYSNIGKTYEDHNAVDAEIEGDCGEDVIWTVVLAAALTQDGRKPVRTSGHTQAGASFSVTRESCARWMVDVAAGNMEDKFSNKRVIVSN